MSLTMKNKLVVLIGLFFMLGLFQSIALANEPLSLKNFEGAWVSDYQLSTLSYIDPDATVIDLIIVIDAAASTMTMIVEEEEETSTITNINDAGGSLTFTMDGFALALKKRNSGYIEIVDQDDIIVFKRLD